jgi:hypothetical protein
MSHPTESAHARGPETTRHELKIAYNQVIEANLVLQRKTPNIDEQELPALYRHAFRLYREGKYLAAERWARTTKHLARALKSEAKVLYLEAHFSELPFLEHATLEELGLYEHSDTTADLLSSLEEDLPPGCTEMPEKMKSYLARGREQLATLDKPGYTHQLTRAERIKAAHEYGRTVECMALAFEADHIEKGKDKRKTA